MDMIQPSPDTEMLRRRVAQLINAGRTGAARPLLAAIRTLSPEVNAEVALLAARLTWREGDTVQALRELDSAVDVFPADAKLRKSRAELHQIMGNKEGAARDAAEAVILDPDDPDAKAILGATLLDLGRAADAAACLAEAFAKAPSVLSYRQALAMSLERIGQVEAAFQLLKDGIAIAPTNVSLSNAAILLCMRRRDFSGAVQLADQARLRGIADADTFGMKGHALASLGDHESAAIAYQEALKLRPDDPSIKHLVMTAGSLPSADRAPAEYLRSVFDGYADRFETHLLSLDYVAPARIRHALEAHPKIAAGLPLGPVLDLGCGTGLVALAIGDLPLGPMTGIDVSPRMLEHARVKRLYAELIESDIVAALTADTTRQWPLMIAADVLIYFGALEALFAAVHARLEPGGWFIFSVEDLLPDYAGVTPGNGSWALHRLGRYAHAPDYVRETIAAAGFRVVSTDRLPMRQEAGLGVPGRLMAVEKLASARCSPHDD